jgi:1,2-diacylglycerol 3-alpha-glucosyltransferase
MHVLFFGDQHPHTLGGAQVSITLQGEFLDKSGGIATWVSPALRGGVLADPRFIDVPSLPLSPFDKYTWFWPSRRALNFVEQALEHRPVVDIVHVQADFWSAALGYAYARRHNIPVVHTMHNRVDVGIDAVIPFPSLVYALFGVWQRWALGSRVPRVSDGWSYLAHYARRAAVVTAPSRHFSARLESNGVVSPVSPQVRTIPNGIDDQVLSAVGGSVTHKHAEPTVVWLGRFSAEKRLIDFIRATRLLDPAIRVRVVGTGLLETKARSMAGDNVEFVGMLTYEQALTEIARAHVLVQTSNGFETQGMTVMEAVALGTHAVVIDSDIAAELPEGTCSVVPGLDDESLAASIHDAIAAHSGTERTANFRAEFSQSSRTQQMNELYAEVLGTRPE